MSDEPYVAVDEVAERLGLPLGVLVRRVQAGDVPARRIDGPDGPRYELRMGDLGIEDPAPNEEPVAEDGTDIELTGSTVPEAFAKYPVQTPVEIPVEIAVTADEAEPAGVSASSVIEIEIDEVTAAVPPPRATEAAELTLIDYPRTGPLADIASMQIDPRELVAGLLDRWERTLEQRIYAEQRQRFEAELNARQNTVKELQLELKMAHADHAAQQAEKERVLAERERSLQDRERELATVRAELSKAGKRKRGWFFGR
jgi:hypothetical protein